MFFSKLKKFKLKRKDKFFLSDLPFELLSIIFDYIPKPELINLWNPKIFNNCKISYVICYLLINEVYLHNFSLSQLKKCFSINEERKVILRHYPDVLSVPRQSSKEFFAIYKFSQLNRFHINPKSINILFFISSPASYTTFIDLINLLHYTMGKPISNLKIYLRLASQLTFPLGLPPLQSLHILNTYSNFQNLQDLRLTDLILDGNLKGHIISYPRGVKHILVNPSNESYGNISMSLQNLPNTVTAILLGENITLNDTGGYLPNLTSIIARVEEPLSVVIIRKFLQNNCKNIKYLQLKSITLSRENLVSLKRLRVLFLWKCSLIPYDQLKYSRKLKRLWLIECDLNLLASLSIPPELKDIRIAPCDKEFLEHLLPPCLKNKVAEGQWL